MSLKDICSCAGVFKLLTIVLGFFSLVVGVAGYFGQKGEKVNGMKVKCSGECETGLKLVEPWFLAIVASTFLVSVFGFISLMLCCKSKGCFKFFDVCFHAVGGTSLIIVASIMIASTMESDSKQNATSNGSIVEKNEPEEARLRQEEMFSEKLAAGGLAVFNGFVYLITTCIVSCAAPAPPPDTD